MYPIFRTATTMLRARRLPQLDLLGVDVTPFRCWPIDIDLFVELNNGRTLTLYDLGRFSLAYRMGLIGVLRRKGWGLAVAGVSIRFRKRVLPFQKLEMRTRSIGWDARFIYLEQSIWRGNECCSHMLIRTAVTGKHRAVPTSDVLEALGEAGREAPDLPDWAQAWVDAELLRPWPPTL